MSAKLKTVRWTVNAAAAEFGIDRHTLSNYLKENGIAAGEDDKFSTREICVAIYGDYETERTGLTREQKETAAIKKSNLLRENIPADLVERVWGGVLIDLKQRINCAAIPDAAKLELSRDLMAIPIEDYFKDSKPTDEESEEE